MKKLKFIIVSFMLFACSATYAIGMDIDTSIEFALSKANFKMKNSGMDINNELGYGIGVAAKAKLPLVDIGPELWYFRNTASVEDGGDIKSNSIDLPIVVSYEIYGPLSVEAGPSFSLASFAKYKYDDNKTKLGRVRPEVGYLIGLKVDVLDILTLSGRFNGCFSRKDVDFGEETYAMRYNAWTVGVGVKF